MSIPTAAMRSLLVSRALKESSYGSAATVDRRSLVSGPAMRPMVTLTSPEADLDAAAPAAYAASVAEWYESRWRWDSVRPDDLAWALSFTLGAGTSTTVDGTAVRHRIAPDSARALPSFTAEEVVASGWHDRYSGGIIRCVSLSGGADSGADVGTYGIEMHADSLFRSRQGGDGSGAAITDEPAWQCRQSRLWLGAAYGGTQSQDQADLTDAVEWTGQWMGFRALFDNAVERERLPDFTGSTLARPERGVRTYELRLAVEIDDRTMLDALIGSTVRAAEIEWAGGVLAGSTSVQFGVQLIWPRLVPEQVVTRDGHGGRLTADIDWRVLSDSTHGPFVAVIWNQIPSYAQ